MLELSETYFFTPYVWHDSPSFPPSHLLREFISLFAFVAVGAVLMYFALATLAYVFLFDREVLNDRRFLPHQVRREIRHTMESIPTVVFLTTVVFHLEVRGYSALYDDLSERSVAYSAFSVFAFLAFTDCLIYFIHRALHDVKFLYKYVHKPHHLWKVTTPFASHAFHPFDGFAQSAPYHIFAFFFPFNKWIYLGMYVFVNMWTVSIHDCCYAVPWPFRGVINGAAHHSDHHAHFVCNYGQYTTLWDRLGGTFRTPTAHGNLKGPAHDSMAAAKRASGTPAKRGA